MYENFGYNKSGVKDLLWLNMMGEVRKGLGGLARAYNP